ncbi:MAG: hypothetical protein KUG71_05710 [Porticoccaceae bacterium]|nr:hypothetical protein [Porticoccaceae bacterium]
MATLSLKSIASSCLGASPSFSVKRDVYGYIWGPIDRRLSLRSHLQLIKDDAFNLCIFLVGHEPGFAGWWSQSEAQSMQLAIDVMRNVYAQTGVGVRRLFWRYIDTNEAAGFWSVDAGEATDLTEAFTGPNNGIDVFFVKNVSDAGGWSNSSGPCDKDEKGERTGAVLELRSDDCTVGTNLCTGILLAHEVGHYLTLKHESVITNVMGEDADGNGIGSIDNTSLNLDNDQSAKMKKSCFIRPSC